MNKKLLMDWLFADIDELIDMGEYTEEPEALEYAGREFAEAGNKLG